MTNRHHIQISTPSWDLRPKGLNPEGPPRDAQKPNAPNPASPMAVHNSLIPSPSRTSKELARNWIYSSHVEICRKKYGYHFLCFHVVCTVQQTKKLHAETAASVLSLTGLIMC